MRRTLTLLLCLLLAAPAFAADLTARGMNQWYKDLLQVSNSNSGIDATLRAVSDGEGTDSPLGLSTTMVAVKSDTAQLGFGATPDVGLIRYAGGYLKATNGSTGDGQFLAAGFNTWVGSTGYNALTTSALSQINESVIKWGTDAGLARVATGVVGFTNASTDAGKAAIVTANGASVTWFSASELLTVAAANTSTTVADLLPANSIIDAVTWRVTTVIPSAGTFSVGDGTTAARFGTGVAVAAGTTGVGIAHNSPDVATAAAGPVQTSAAKIVITWAGGDPSDATGRVRLTVFGHTYVAPTS